MPTRNPHINVTFDKDVSDLLSKLAEHEDKSLSNVVRDLAIKALERREDLYLSSVAEQADTENAKTISHKNAWK